MAGRGLINVESSGIITPCMFLPIKLGNIKKDKISTVWKSHPLLNKLRIERTNVLKGSCKRCKFNNVCGGCRASAYSIYKDLFRSDPLCWRP